MKHKTHFRGRQVFAGKLMTGPACGSIPNVVVNGKVQKALMTVVPELVTCERCIEKLKQVGAKR